MQTKSRKVGETMSLHRIRRIAAAVVVMLALLCSEALAASVPCYINANTKIYNRPWTSAQSLGVPAGLPCYMLACEGNWALVQRDGVQAFIPLPYLTLANRLTAYAAKDTPLYKSASTSSGKILTIPKGNTVYINGRDGSFFRVQDESGSITGFVPGDSLTSSKPAAPTPAPAPNRLTAYAAKNTPLYSKPSTSSSRILTIPKGNTVYVVAKSGNYCMVQDESGSITGFVEAGNLSSTKPGSSNDTPTVSRITAYAVVDTPLLAEPSTSAKKVLTISKGTAVYVVGESNGFCYVQDYNASVSGFVLTASLSMNKPSADTPPSSDISDSLLSTTSSYSSGMSNAQKLEYVIYVAQNLYGRPYASNANPPESFDCSRFVRYCFAQAEIDLPSTALDQGYNGGYATITSISSLKRGDVVCFDTEPTDGDLSDHTGIYLGQGYFIHSSSGAGKVIVSSLTSGYYKDNFSWGRRILN